MTVAALLLLLLLWTASYTTSPSAGTASAAVALVAAGYATGRLLSRSVAARTATAGSVAAVVLAAVVLSPGGLSGVALALPLRYGNANGALVALGAGAALVVALSQRTTRLRLAGVAVSAVFVPVAVLTASRAGAAVTTALVLLGALLALRPTAGRPAPVLGAAAVLLGVLLTAGLAASQAQTPAERALSDRRVVLWSEALDLLEGDPLRGVGPGGFARQAPTAVADPDARWTHSLWLQQAAETGLPGLVLVLLPAGCVLLRVRADGWEDGGVPAMGAALTAGLLLHASIDYVFHFPVVLGLTALLAGLTLAPRRL